MLFLYPFVFLMGLSFLVGPLGSIMLWRKMTFFGDTLAHSTLVAYLLHALSGYSLLICMLGVVTMYACILEVLYYQKQDYAEFIPLLSYGATGIALLLIDWYIKKPALVYKVFLGDLLLVHRFDCIGVLCLAFCVLCFVGFYYRRLLLMLFSEDLAKLKYPRIRWLSFFLNLAIGIAVVFSVQSVGLLLAMALFTLPASIAALYTQHPWQMMRQATVHSLVASVWGLVWSIFYNYPTGPCIIVVLVGMYFCMRGYRSWILKIT